MEAKRRVLALSLLAIVVSVGATAWSVQAMDRRREAAAQAEFEEMACSFHMSIDSTDDKAAGQLVQVVTGAVRSGNQELWSAAYDLQQDVVRYGSTSDRVASDRARIESLCEHILG